jgi:cysteine desulfuration protein SufE
MSADLPPSLTEICAGFHELDGQDRLLYLLEFADDLPKLPSEYLDHPELLERVEECQSPVFLVTEVDAPNEKFNLIASAPLEAPTTRGFASILVHGLGPLTPAEVLAVPIDFPQELGLTQLVTPLRLRGMTFMLARIQRQVREKLAAAAAH